MMTHMKPLTLSSSSSSQQQTIISPPRHPTTIHPTSTSTTASISGKEIIRVFSSSDSHTYWTLVVDKGTTTKDVQTMVVDKLGEQQVSSAALTIVLEITHDNNIIDTIQLADDESLLNVRSKLKKKFKRSDKLRFVVQGLEKIEKRTPTRHVRTKSRDSSEGDGKTKKDKKGNSKERLDIKHGERPTTQTTNDSPTAAAATASPLTVSASATTATTTASTSATTTTTTTTTTTSSNTEKKPRSKEGANKISVVTHTSKTKKHLTLIHVFYNNHIYWTLAIDPTCIVGEVCKILEEKLSLKHNTRVSLYEVELDQESALSPRTIPTTMLPTTSSTPFTNTSVTSDNNGYSTNTNNTTPTMEQQSPQQTTATPTPTTHDPTSNGNNTNNDLVNDFSNGHTKEKGASGTPAANQMFKGLINPNLAITRLGDDVLVMDVLNKWGKSTKWKFFVKEDPIISQQSDIKKTKSTATPTTTTGHAPSHKAPILICASEKTSSDTVDIPLTQQTSPFSSSPSASSQFSPAPTLSEEQRKNPINIWIPEVEIKFVKKISSGAFAKVFQGVYKGKQVAVKVLKGSLSEEVIANFKHEFTILSQVKSPYLVTFYGAYIQKKLTMVMEYCPRGTLYDVLKNPNENISWERVLTFFTQTVKGIQALHNCTPPILHRDLKSLNLLVAQDWVVKVADFGLSRFNTVSNHSSLGRICGTMAYCAPEVYTGERFSVKSDVYSLGIILWELVSRCACKEYKAPYSEYSFISFDFQIIIQTSQHGLRPSIPVACPPALAALIQGCWQASPQQRPNCDEILQILDALSVEFQKNPQRMGIL